MTKLYGRDRLTRGHVPHLVGLEYGRDRRVDTRRGPGVPVLHCVGGRGTGKTALLQDLSEAYSQRVPQAYADLAAPGFGDTALATVLDGSTPNASPTTDLLYHLSYQLGLRVREFGRPLTFPRLVQGLLAITSWQAETEEETAGAAVRPAELAAAQARLGELLRGSQPDRQQRIERVRVWTDAVAQRIGPLAGLPPALDTVVQATIDVVAAELLSPRAHGGALKWWSARTVAPQGDGLQQLVALARAFRNADERRTRAERHLVAALIADVGDYYGWWRSANGVPRPLVLLDNAHTPLGEDFLTLLRHAYEETAGAGDTVRLVTVTAALGAEAEEAGYSGAEPARPGGEGEPDAAAGPCWPRGLGLAPLAVDDIEAMFGADAPPVGLARLVHRLSDGRAAVANALVRAAVRQLRGGCPVRPGELLDLPVTAAAGSTVTSAVLRELLPDPVARRRLGYFAPALDDAAAHRLSRTFPPDDPGGVPVQEAKEYLRRNAWPTHAWPSGVRPLVGDRTLRALLLHALGAAPDALADPDTWADMHRQLRAHYDPQGLGPEAATHDVRYLHHSLALNDLSVVVQTLHRQFAEGDAAAWLAAVNLVCAAPHPPPALVRPPATERPCPGCLSGDRLVHQAIALLVEHLWRQSAPLAMPDDALINKVGLQLNILAQHSEPAAQDIFFRAQLTWPERMRRWAQAPDLPVPEGPDP